jgi:CO/xanthine dehydrogenase Mo-binding subunit
MASILVQRKEGATGRGASYQRIDAYERVSGKAKYSTDWHVPGMIYARVITSSVPHGIVKSIDKEKILSTPGVEALVTCLDDKTMWTGGDREHERKLFADHPRFVGDTIGALAAKTRKIAEEAAEQAVVDYDPLPAVFAIDDALNPSAPKAWDNNNVSTASYGFGDTKATFEKADQFLEREYKSARIHPVVLEPIISLAWWEDNYTKLTVVAGTQSIHAAREGLSKDLGLPLENVRVICRYKGGGFGGRGNGAINYDLIAALLSRKAGGKPVMLEASREQDFPGTHTRWSTREKIRAAVNTTRGELLGVEIKAYADIGAYSRRPKRMTYSGLLGEDYVQAMSIEEFNVYTNTPTTGAMRAPAGPQVNFAIETLVDEIAHELKINPLDFRLNCIRAKYAGVDLAHHYTSFGFLDCFKLGSEVFGWRDRWRPAPSLRQTLESDGRLRKLRGVGVSGGKWHARLGNSDASVKLRSDGKIEVAAGVVDIGTGAKSTMAGIAAEALGVPLSQIELEWGDTQTTPFAPGEGGSKTTTCVGIAVRTASTNLKNSILQVASKKLGVRPNDIEIDQGEVREVGTARTLLSLAEVAKLGGKQELVEKVSTNPQLPEHTERESFTAHFVEVEVDIETGFVEIPRYVAVHDSGKIVNRLTAESQVKGGIVMGLGMALSEELRIDPNYGNFINSNLMTYKIPTHSMAPDNIEVYFVETNDPYGPKSLGEPPIVPVLSAVGNAIFNATGLRLRETPFTPDRILAAAVMNRSD